MLKFRDVCFSYPGQPIFNNINLHIQQDEFVFLIGNSGVGKTTLLQMINMNTFPQSGYVEFAGFRSNEISYKRLPYLRRRIGVIFQDFKLLEERNVYDNIAFVLRVTGMPKRQIKKRVFTVLSDVGLLNKQKNMPSQLSGGEKQRVAISRAIVNDPMLILADEPTGNLDPETSEEILALIRKIHTRGTSVIFATHNYEIIKKIDTKIIKLRDGKVYNAQLRKKEII